MVDVLAGFTQDRQAIFLAQALDAALASSSPTDFCKQVVHAPIDNWLIRGCALYFVDNQSQIKLLASYGQILETIPGLSAWDDSPLSEAVREKGVRFGSLSPALNSSSIMAIPFLANGSPRGLVALVVDKPHYSVELPEKFFQMLSKLGALYLDALEFGKIATTQALAEAHPDDLTVRQLVILGHIQSGLVNVLIAKLLMLSESTIRQETVKIYRSLGVGNRLEAVKKAKVLGLLPRIVSVPD
jgi:DNA-binding NarL/FixJ family response regulator